jgi:hypothetical protein
MVQDPGYDHQTRFARLSRFELQPATNRWAPEPIYSLLGFASRRGRHARIHGNGCWDGRYWKDKERELFDNYYNRWLTAYFGS